MTSERIQSAPIAWPTAKAPWEVLLTWQELEGRMECVAVELRASEATPRPVTATTWREVPVARIIESERAAEHAHRDGVADEQRRAAIRFDHAKAAADAWTADAARWSRSKYDLGEVARVYLDAWHHKTNRPTKAVAEHFIVSPSAAAKLVARARAAGLIPPTTRGRAQGSPTPPAKKRTKASRATS